MTKLKALKEHDNENNHDQSEQNQSDKEIDADSASSTQSKLIPVLLMTNVWLFIQL